MSNSIERVFLDMDGNAGRRFSNRGGKAILFPQNWNENHAVSNRIGYVREALERLTKD